MNSAVETREVFPFVTPTALQNFDSANIKVAFLDLEDRFTFVNQSMKEAFGDDVQQKSLAEILGNHAYESYKAAKKELLESDKVVSLSFDIDAEGGANSQLTLYLIRDIGSKPLYTRIFFRDAADLHELSLQNAKAGGELQRAHVIYSEVDRNGFFIRSEGKFTQHVVAQVVGKHFTEVYKSLPESQERIRRAMAGEEFEVEVNASGLWFQVWYSPLYDSNGELSGASWSSYPIDKFHHQAVKLEKTVAEAQCAVQAREDLLSMASHEIKNPLTGLSLNFRVMENYLQRSSDTHLKDSTQSLLASSQRFIDRISTLTQRLLDATSLGAQGLVLRRERCDLSQLLKDTVQKYADRNRQLSGNIEVETPEALPAYCDSLRMEQVMENLLTNAIKYGGNAPISLRLKQTTRSVELEVEDRGPGISFEDQTKIFERFVRSEKHKNVAGFGVGLYIVRQIVEAHGGSVRVNSEPNKGSTFTVTLPLGNA